MKNKEFREIQVSSSLLVVIFLGVLALGVFIFLLGISVGKKQVRISSQTQVVTQQIPEPVKGQPVKPTLDEAASAPTSVPSGADSSRQATGPAAQSPAKGPAVTPQKAPAETAKKPLAAASGLYYVQIAAFTERAQAQALADKYKKQGYAPVIDPRQASTKTWYRVRLGGYASRDKAVDLLDKLNAAAGKKTDFQIVHD